MPTNNYLQNISLFIAVCFLVSVWSCSNDTQKSNDVKVETKLAMSESYFGSYHGKQDSYFLKNQQGDEMVISGNKIAVPECDFIFYIKENNVVSLEQTNLEDNTKAHYDGTYRVVTEDSSAYHIECLLSDGKSSSPTYQLVISKANFNSFCKGYNEPVFRLEKNN